MVEFDSVHQTFKISIPITDPQQASRYHQSLVRLLEKIEIDDNKPSFIEDLGCVYELLSHLLPDQGFMDRHKNLNNQR